MAQITLCVVQITTVNVERYIKLWLLRPQYHNYFVCLDVLVLIQKKQQQFIRSNRLKGSKHKTQYRMKLLTPRNDTDISEIPSLDSLQDRNKLCINT